MKIAVVLETKDRRLSGLSENYVATTLQNLERSGCWKSPHFHSLHIVSNGELDESFFDKEIGPYLPVGGVFEYNYKRGRRDNALRCIEVGARSDADYVMKLEDDLDFVDDFLNGTAAWVESVKDVPALMYCLGSSWGETVTPVNTSLYKEKGESVLGPGESFQYARRAIARGEKYLLNQGFWGGQALMWKRPVAEQLAEWFEEHINDKEVGGQDILLQKWGQQLRPAAFLVPLPSFVQHIGRQSNMNVQFFEFPWPGRDWSYLRSVA